MNPLRVGAFGLIAWGLYRLLAKQQSPLSTQATSVTTAKPPTPSPSVATNSNIAAIQARLNALGANPPLVVDGISGPKTLAAIKAFQSAHGITPDGIVGPITQAALAQGNTVPTASTVATPTVATPTSYEQIPLITNTFTPHEETTNESSNFHETVHTWADEPEQSFRNKP